MPTPFVVSVKSSGGDFTSLQTAQNTLKCRLDVTTTKVFSISAYTTPTLANGDAVTGLTSNATGLCVWVNVERTQILIRSISGTFQAETIKKTSDAGVTVTTSDTGDSAIASFALYAMHDTTYVSFIRNVSTAWVTSSTNYIKVYTVPSARHSGKWDEAKYYIDGGADTGHNTISFQSLDIWIDGLQVQNLTLSGWGGIICSSLNNARVYISNNILRSPARNTSGVGIEIYSSSPGIVYVWNNVIYDMIEGIDNYPSNNGTQYWFNNTVYNADQGYYSESGTAGALHAWNNIAQACGDGFYLYGAGSDWGDSDYNLSDIADDAPGANSVNNASVAFVDSASKDFRLSPSDTSGARGGGAYDPGSGLFSDDITSSSRGGPKWDIGAFQCFGAPVAWGEEASDEPARTWQDWEVSLGVNPTIIGDQDWGQMGLNIGTPTYSAMIDTGDTNNKTFTVDKNKYGSGTGTVTIYIRGSASTFGKFDGSPSWTEYTAPTSQTWRYAQLKVEAQ